MLGIEVNERLRPFWIPPHLSQHADIHAAHQLLAEDIKAVSYMIFQNVVVVFEWTFALGMVIIIIIEKRLTQ
jgi:hypothetical protein